MTPDINWYKSRYEGLKRRLLNVDKTRRCRHDLIVVRRCDAYDIYKCRKCDWFEVVKVKP